MAKIVFGAGTSHTPMLLASDETLQRFIETDRNIKHRDKEGRPVTYGTNTAFLSHFGLDAVSDLPGLDELRGSGLLDGRLPNGFSVPIPSDDPALRADEDPLEPGDLDLGLAPPSERTEEQATSVGDEAPGDEAAGDKALGDEAIDGVS